MRRWFYRWRLREWERRFRSTNTFVMLLDAGPNPYPALDWRNHPAGLAILSYHREETERIAHYRTRLGDIPEAKLLQEK